MKTKILFKLFLAASLGLIYMTVTSSSGGIYNGGTSCGGGGCHGTTANTATTVSWSGLPTSFTPGQTYPLTFTVINSAKAKSGFNVLVTGGTLTAGSGTIVGGGSKQITQTQPMTAASGISSYSFSWTAPATTGAVTINAVGNAVNGNGNADSGDQWNTLSVTISGGWPAAVNDVQNSNISCYPNPANDFLMVDGINENAKQIVIYNLYGQSFTPSYTFESSHCRVDCNNLASGMYILSANVDGKRLTSSFTKN